MSAKSELARLARYDKALSEIMPLDFKDWFQNSKEEWPEVAAYVILNLRNHLDDANAEIDKLYGELHNV